MNRTTAKSIILLAVCAAAGAGFLSCRRTNEAKERVQEQRKTWHQSLIDSVKTVEAQTDSLKIEIASLTRQTEEMLPLFDYVDNPREVEGYYIHKKWKARYPLKSTGLMMRITKGEKAELIAALAGGAHFDRIRVEAGGRSAESSVVPHDQALNYRMAGLNTVCFSDSASDSCARLIAESAGEKVTISYLEGGRTTGSLTYPDESKGILSDTWRLYDMRSGIRRDERMIPMLAKKGAIINAKLEEIATKDPG